MICQTDKILAQGEVASLAPSEKLEDMLGLVAQRVRTVAGLRFWALE